MRQNAWIAALGVLVACSGVTPDPKQMAADLPPAVDVAADDRMRLDEETARALVALEDGDPGAARRIVARVLDADPRHARARAILGHCLMAEARQDDPPVLDTWRRAEGEILRAVEIAPQDPVVGLLHARFLIADGHLTAAADVLGVLVERHPDDVSALELAGRVRFDIGDERAATPLLQAYLVLAPDDAAAQWRLAQSYARVATAALDDAERDARLADAVFAFERYRELEPDDADGALGEAHARHAKLIATGSDDPADVEAILALYDRAAELTPDAPGPSFERGVVLETAGRVEAAEAAYRAALDLDPAHAASLVNLVALVATDAERRDEAIELARRALALESGLTRRERSALSEFASPPADGEAKATGAAESGR